MTGTAKPSARGLRVPAGGCWTVSGPASGMPGRVLGLPTGTGRHGAFPTALRQRTYLTGVDRLRLAAPG